jgi:hypothetical protein
MTGDFGRRKSQQLRERAEQRVKLTSLKRCLRWIPDYHFTAFEASRQRKEHSMAEHPAIQSHLQAAEHHRAAADYHELAAKRYDLGDHAQAAHYALLAQAHAFHARDFMAEAAKIHAAQHGGNISHTQRDR